MRSGKGYVVRTVNPIRNVWYKIDELNWKQIQLVETSSPKQYPFEHQYQGHDKMLCLTMMLTATTESFPARCPNNNIWWTPVGAP